VLEDVDLQHQRIGVDGRADFVSRQDEDAGEVTALDGFFGQIDGALQGVFEGAGGEQPSIVPTANSTVRCKVS
jgi:hypothetical protein